jgi:multifunctional methyltransferase subunit TRM112
MKLLTTNFLTCAVKACKSSPASFPLHFKDATLERTEITFNPLFITNVLPRVNWDALTATANELGLAKMLPERNPVDQAGWYGEQEGMTDEEKMEVESEQTGKESEEREESLKKLHNLLLETAVVEGKLVCGNCGFEYPIKDGVGNFLLPAHLV